MRHTANQTIYGTKKKSISVSEAVLAVSHTDRAVYNKHNQLRTHSSPVEKGLST